MRYPIKELEAKMEKVIDAYKANLAVIRASQANPAVLNRLTFEYYGTPTPLNTMAMIRISDPRTLQIAPYDRNSVKAIVKAILASDIGITPVTDGQVILLSFPPLTEEHRRDVIRQVQRMGEEAKVTLRSERHAANDETKQMKKDNLMTEDDVDLAKKDIQEATDRYVRIVDDVTAAKEKELMVI